MEKCHSSAALKVTYVDIRASFPSFLSPSFVSGSLFCKPHKHDSKSWPINSDYNKKTLMSGDVSAAELQSFGLRQESDGMKSTACGPHCLLRPDCESFPLRWRLRRNVTFCWSLWSQVISVLRQTGGWAMARWLCSAALIPTQHEELLAANWTCTRG